MTLPEKTMVKEIDFQLEVRFHGYHGNFITLWAQRRWGLGAIQILAPFPNLLGKHFTMVIANRHNFMVVKELGP